ncbi:glycosyltransferase family 2 protein [Kitasatospora sp. RG8]|uniref:glycosyltransferase family 2 protein n=1 Tax=Kitasatospora sp. RG8 TaxID=2820815 RepID=UPI001ADED180|nr:glycosyltransferase family 2 protein [Kitasatospora sp. RG8]MBP0448050.1 glycosyltransferase family 2 protein [Kitasatospora sp. RG8]
MTTDQSSGRADDRTPERAADGRAPSLTVVICAYTVERWDDLCAAVASVRGQHHPPAEVLLVVDHCPELLHLAREHLSADARILPSRQQRGLSGARNTALAAAHGELIAFLDDDATADPAWTGRLLAGYRTPAVLGVGGHVRPWWQSGRPDWFPPEFDWVVGCSYRGLPSRPAGVRNLIGANMSFRRAEALAAGGFRTDLGRVGRRPLGCEETELCIRLAARHPGAVLRYEPAAAVLHRVPPARTTFSYFAARCFAEGRSKAAVVRHDGAAAGLASERAYLRHTVPAALLDSLRRRRPATAAALCAGVTLTAAGYLTGLAGGWAARTAPRRTGAVRPATRDRTAGAEPTKARPTGGRPTRDGP